jgi:hypothetical protein
VVVRPRASLLKSRYSVSLTLRPADTAGNSESPARSHGARASEFQCHCYRSRAGCLSKGRHVSGWVASLESWKPCMQGCPRDEPRSLLFLSPVVHRGTIIDPRLHQGIGGLRRAGAHPGSRCPPACSSRTCSNTSLTPTPTSTASAGYGRRTHCGPAFKYKKVETHSVVNVRL